MLRHLMVAATATGAKAAGWAAIGAGIGYLVEFLWMGETLLQHPLPVGAALVAFGAAVVRPWVRVRSPQGLKVRDRLLDADDLFAHGLIDEEEHRAMRASILVPD